MPIKRSTPGWLRWTTLIGVAVIATLLAFRVYYPFSPRGRQARNLAVAAKHLPAIRQVIGSDSRFRGVLAEPYTGNDGIIVFGFVKAEKDSDDV